MITLRRMLEKWPPLIYMRKFLANRRAAMYGFNSTGFFFYHNATAVSRYSGRARWADRSRAHSAFRALRRTAGIWRSDGPDRPALRPRAGAAGHVVGSIYEGAWPHEAVIA